MQLKHRNLDSLISDLETALTNLEYKLESCLIKQNDAKDVEEQLQRVNYDRTQLAAELDNSSALVEKLLTVNNDASHRLVTLMEKVRKIIEED